MSPFELDKARAWAVGMIIAAIIIFILMTIVFSTGWPGDGSVFGVTRGDSADVRTNFVLTLILFVLGVVLLVVGIGMNALCNNHRRFMKEYDEMIDDRVKRIYDKINQG